MRYSTKSGLAIVMVFLTVLGGVAIWLERELRATSHTILTETARLVGREVAAALAGSTLQQLLSSDPSALPALKQIVTDVTARSEMVTSVMVVDGSGTVLADDEGQVGRTVALPRVIFGDELRPRFVAAEEHGPGRFVMFVPLLQDQHLEGYLRLGLGSDHIAKLHSRARRNLAVAGVVGLLSVVVLSLLLHVQLARVGGALTAALQAAMRGDDVPTHHGDNEFAHAFEAVDQVRQELSAAREKGAQAQRRFGSLMQVMDVGILLLNPRTELDFLNQRARELLGGGDAAAWQSGWQAVSAVLEPHLESASQPASGTRLDIDLTEQRAGSRLRLELTRLSEEDCEGYLILVKSRDTIEALENELRLAIQMRGFARFYMAFAHDLKAPLNAMVMNLELLNESLRRRDEGNGDQQDRQRRYIDVLRSEIKRLDRYLQTLLHQAAVPSAAVERFDLRDIIADLATLLGPQAKQQRVTLDAEVPEMPVVFSGHRDRLKQALLNIAINALEAMPNGGRMAMALAQAPGEAQIAISDSGPGIPPALLDEIYKMHFTTKDGGTGIGLYVARSVIEAHGGRIDVTSEAGRGTRFAVAFPAPPTADLGWHISCRTY